MKILVTREEAKTMVQEAINNNTTIYIQKANTTNIYAYTFYTKKEYSWSTTINVEFYNLDNEGKIEMTGKRNEDSRTFNHLKEMLHMEENIISNNFDDLKRIAEDVWLQEKAKHQETILLGLFA